MVFKNCISTEYLFNKVTPRDETNDDEQHHLREGRMTNSQDEDTTVYEVVVNTEEQYSIWPAYKAIPLGWQTVGQQGFKGECLEYIKSVWVDMRPLSLRNQVEATRRHE